ncbi:MAG TPA: alpha/beta hydrolase [Bryobacteraceae bacterium]|nr:alpha/beta hydrolase [Bryobacteraceae bacterium]
MEPVSHFFYSHRLKLQFWDWGTEGKPVMILVHGGLDHARSWDWVARALRHDYRVYALDLRGHGNSAWAPGALYSVAEHVLDLSALADIVAESPVTIVGHSLGAAVTLLYAGIYPDRVEKVVAIEGVGLPPARKLQETPPADRIRQWIEKIRSTEQRTPHSYPDLASAVARMKEANPFLSDEVAQHLTLHGTNWNADGSIIWKFDNFARVGAPYGMNVDEMAAVMSRIECPVELFWGRESFTLDPEKAPEAAVLRDRRIVKVDRAGHWVHHDRLELFLEEAKKFLSGGC